MAHEQTSCKACGRPIAQIGGGHRPRLYCDDNCKQAAFRERREREHKDAITRHWSSFTSETRGFLDWLSTRASYGEDLAINVEHAINRELEECKRGLEQVQERYRAYVEMSNERMSDQAGELATLRQERERGAKRLTKADMRELEQARTDLLRLYQERAREQEEIHQLSELAHDLQRRLGAAHNRIAELEQQLAECKRDQQVAAIAIDEALLDIGRKLGFPQLDFTRYGDNVPVHIKAGELYWTNFSLRADCCDVKRALEAASNRNRPGD